ncbi:MAG: DUF177 domain-containing protein [Methylococcales bacterium]|nr:DUF177 domain-containing protein [Methylococcales bacterium]MCK5925395.1 DUF177 domain-containing protein [Methylococcales bacterium]
MLGRLPNFIDPHAFADKRRQLSGDIALNQFSRLSDVLSDDQGSVNIQLSFLKNRRLSLIQGDIQTELRVDCQSCLKIMTLPLAVSINLAVVESLAQAEKLASEYDPLIVNEKKISLINVIEDELLLAIPDFPRHEHLCLEPAKQTDVIETTTEPNNPFSILAQLKNTGDL